jgi:hypothetical protein
MKKLSLRNCAWMPVLALVLSGSTIFAQTTAGHILKWNGTTYVDSVITETNGNIVVGSATGANVGTVPFHVVTGASSAIYFREFGSGIVKIQGANANLSQANDIVLQPDTGNVGIGAAPGLLLDVHAVATKVGFPPAAA